VSTDESNEEVSELTKAIDVDTNHVVEFISKTDKTSDSDDIRSMTKRASARVIKLKKLFDKDVKVIETEAKRATSKMPNGLLKNNVVKEFITICISMRANYKKLLDEHTALVNKVSTMLEENPHLA
jgi:3-hydroxyisobutyrate dehydrogenase-like beta-hydroxyacid dehydrogenase